MVLRVDSNTLPSSPHDSRLSLIRSREIMHNSWVVSIIGSRSDMANGCPHAPIRCHTEMRDKNQCHPTHSGSGNEAADHSVLLHHLHETRIALMLFLRLYDFGCRL